MIKGPSAGWHAHCAPPGSCSSSRRHRRLTQTSGRQGSLSELRRNSWQLMIGDGQRLCVRTEMMPAVCRILNSKPPPLELDTGSMPSKSGVSSTMVRIRYAPVKRIANGSVTIISSAVKTNVEADSVS